MLESTADIDKWGSLCSATLMHTWTVAFSKMFLCVTNRVNYKSRVDGVSISYANLANMIHNKHRKLEEVTYYLACWSCMPV